MTNEKAFDLLNYTFLISTLEKFGFEKTFIDWIKRITTKYFKLEKGAWQGHPCVSVSFYNLFRDTFLC